MAADAEDLWTKYEAAAPLRIAWFNLAAPELWEPIDFGVLVSRGVFPDDAAKQEAERAAKRWVLLQLSLGLFTAIGFVREDLGDEPSDMPAPLKLKVVPRLTIDDHSTNWLRNEIVDRHQIYSSVKVIPEPATNYIPANLHPTGGPILEEPIKERKGGPKDTYPLSKVALASLEGENPSLIALSAEQLWPAFAERYRLLHRSAAKLRPPPAIRTLRKQLERYRLFRAGNNRQ